MAHEFVFLINGELKTFTEWENIPEDFDNVIKFLPDVPHSEVDHDAPAGGIWSVRLRELMQRERDNASNM